MKDTRFAISKWAEPEVIYNDMKTLFQEGVRWQIGKAVQEANKKFIEERCSGSRALAEAARGVTPDGMAHNRVPNKPFPIAMKKADGAFVYDIDGNEYIDFFLSGGTRMFGNYPANIGAAYKEMFDGGVCNFGMLNEAEVVLAKEVQKFYPSCEYFRLTSSTTEAVMLALRIARISTNKRRIIKFVGTNHGWCDQMLWGMGTPGAREAMAANGVPEEFYDAVDQILPNDLKELEKTLKTNNRKGGTAAIIIEPLGPAVGSYPVLLNFNKDIANLAARYGALLIFDETYTAFRTGMCGAQGYFEITPDLTIFGSHVVGGLTNQGGIGGRKNYMGLATKGIVPGKPVAVIDDSFSSNAFAAVAGIEHIRLLDQSNACMRSGAMGDKLAKSLKAIFAKYKLPFVAFNQGNIVHLDLTGEGSLDFCQLSVPEAAKGMQNYKLFFKKRKELHRAFHQACIANGLLIQNASLIFVGAEHDDEVLRRALQAFENVFKTFEDTHQEVEAK
jgi:glutamate-1-semialdehyde 2,1-aminomutase